MDEPKWDVPGWDWPLNDHSWLASQSGIYRDGVSIFFIHGGRIRHQAHIPHGDYSVGEFCEMLQERAAGLDGARVCWSDDAGAGYPDLWVEGTRPPNSEDLARLESARTRQRQEDEMTARTLRKRRPDLFSEAAAQREP